MQVHHDTQVEYEASSWKRSIEFFKQENALLKYRLSEIVDFGDSPAMLATAEYFQNQFLLKDEGLRKLGNEIKDFLNQYYGLDRENVSQSHIQRMHQEIREHLLQFENEFLLLAKKFNESCYKVQPN